MTIIQCSQTFDQSTLSKMLDHDPVVQRYRTFFALFDGEKTAPRCSAAYSRATSSYAKQSA